LPALGTARKRVMFWENRYQSFAFVTIVRMRLKQPPRLIAALLHNLDSPKRSTRSTAGKPTLRIVAATTCSSHLMSAISAECLTLPQYVDKSYLESGSGRLPGRELDMKGKTGG
jgi:hypothetical protein